MWEKFALPPLTVMLPLLISVDQAPLKLDPLKSSIKSKTALIDQEAQKVSYEDVFGIRKPLSADSCGRPRASVERSAELSSLGRGDLIEWNGMSCPPVAVA